MLLLQGAVLLSVLDGPSAAAVVGQSGSGTTEPGEAVPALGSRGGGKTTARAIGAAAVTNEL